MNKGKLMKSKKISSRKKFSNPDNMKKTKELLLLDMNNKLKSYKSNWKTYLHKIYTLQNKSNK